MKIKNIASYTGGNVLVALVPFILTPFMTHNLSPEQFGKVAMYQILLAAFSIFVGLSSNGPLVRFNYNSEFKKTSLFKYFYNAFLILLLSFFIVLVFIFLFGGYLEEEINIPKSYLYLALLTSFFFYFIKIRLGQWQVNFRGGYYASLQFIQTALMILLFFLFYFYMFDDENSRILSMSLVTIVVSLCCLTSLFIEGFFSVRAFSREYSQDILKQSIGVLPHLLGIYIISFSDRFIVSKYMGEESVGILMLAIQVSLVLNIFFDGLNKALNPILFRILRDNNWGEKLKVVKITYIGIVALLFLAYPLSLMCSFLITLISPVEYHQAADLVIVIVFSQVINGIYIGFVNYILYSKKLWLLSSISIFTGLINILLSVSLIEVYGLFSTVISGFLCALLRLALVFSFSSRLVSMPWFKFINIKV